MNKWQFKLAGFLFLIFFLTTNINCMIDNRFLPLYRPEYNRYPCKKSIVSSNVFFLFADKARSDSDARINIPEINGIYNLANISKALEIIGKENPLSMQWRSLGKIPWKLKGKIEGQGFWFGYEQAIPFHSDESRNNFSLGISWYLMKIISKQNFILPESTIKELRLDKGGQAKLRQEQLLANKLLGIESVGIEIDG